MAYLSTCDIQCRAADDAAEFINPSNFRVDANCNFSPWPARRVRSQGYREIVEIPVIHYAYETWCEYVDKQAQTQCDEEYF